MVNKRVYVWAREYYRWLKLWSILQVSKRLDRVMPRVCMCQRVQYVCAAKQAIRSWIAHNGTDGVTDNVNQYQPGERGGRRLISAS